MAVRERYPDCTACEAPCCRRQFMEDESGWFDLGDIRPIYLAAGTDVHVVGWARQPDGRQPMIACNAFDEKTLRCGIYATRPEHCRAYDCREDDPDDWRARPHCDLGRHEKLQQAAARSRRARDRRGAGAALGPRTSPPA
ncbi:MAG TPA: YkgJ family cysteine cluster protein [Solirubrobacteraceae bacterium]|nr:YkgJ family cysteine cluster protein [Solirubrobacteraceae bacterium]